MASKDITNQIFGRLTVVKKHHTYSTNGCINWETICICGKTNVSSGADLRSGKVISCGCFRKDNPTITHGMSYTAEFEAWCSMRYRCLNVNHKAYKHYGGRGITICERWLNSFEDFLSDMGLKPTPQHSLDRENNDGNYEPSNCRWATKIQQSRNTRVSTLVLNTQTGIYYSSVSEAAQSCNINKNTLSEYLLKRCKNKSNFIKA